MVGNHFVLLLAGFNDGSYACYFSSSLFTNANVFHRGKAKKYKHIPLRGGRQRIQEVKLLTEIPASVYVAAAQAQAAHQHLQQKHRYQKQQQQLATRVSAQQQQAMGR